MKLRITKNLQTELSPNKQGSNKRNIHDDDDDDDDDGDDDDDDGDKVTFSKENTSASLQYIDEIIALCDS